MAQFATCVKSLGLKKSVLQIFKISRPVVSCNYSRKPHIDPKSVPKPPKRPPTAYLEFFASHVRELKENNKDANIPDLAKICSKQWISLDEDSKKEYEERSKIRFEKYRQELEKFKSGLTEEEGKLIKEVKKQKAQKKKKKKEKKRMRGFGIPKRPMSAFPFYAKSKMPNPNKDTSSKDYMRLLAQQWRQMTDNEKKPFNEMSEKSKIEYEEQMAIWVEQMVDQGDGEEVEKSKLRKQLMKLGMPEKNKSPYKIYRLQNKEKKEADKEAPWSSLTTEQKSKYEKLAKEDKARYEMALDEWYDNMEDLGKLAYAKEAVLLLQAKKPKPHRKRKSKSAPIEDHDLSDSDSD